MASRLRGNTKQERGIALRQCSGRAEGMGWDNKKRPTEGSFPSAGPSAWLLASLLGPGHPTRGVRPWTTRVEIGDFSYRPRRLRITAVKPRLSTPNESLSVLP